MEEQDILNPTTEIEPMDVSGLPGPVGPTGTTGEPEKDIPTTQESYLAKYRELPPEQQEEIKADYLMRTQPFETVEPPSIYVEPVYTGVPIDFNKAIVRGKDPGEVKYRSVAFSRKVIKPDFDQSLKDMNMYDNVIRHPEIHKQLKSFVDGAWDFYNKIEDYHDYTRKRVLPNTPEIIQLATTFGLTPDIQVGTGLQYVRLPKEADMYHYSFIGPIQKEMDQELADGVGSVLYKGNWIPRSSWANMHQKPYLKLVDNRDETNRLPAYYWKAAEPDEVAGLGVIRSVWGPTTMNSSQIGHILRGLTSGFAGQTISGIGATLSAAGYIGRDLINFLSPVMMVSLPKGEIEALNRFTAPIINMGNSLTKVNMDEQEIFGSFGSFTYHFSNAIAQIATMIATGFTTGSIAKASGKFIPMLAKWSPEIARHSSLTVASMQAVGGSADQMYKMGVLRSESAKWMIPFFASTYLVERFVGKNVFTNFYGNRLRNLTKEATEEMGVKYLASTGKRFFDASKGSKAYFVKDMFIKILGDNKKAITTTLGGVRAGAWEEFSEEVIQSYVDKGTAMLYNGLSENRASDIKDEYENVKYEPIRWDYMYYHPQQGTEAKTLTDGYYKTDKFGNRSQITNEQYTAEMEEQAWADKVLSGELLLDTDVQPASWVLAAMAGGTAGSFAKILSGQTNKQKLAVVNLALKVHQGKLTKEQVYKVWDDEQAQNKIFGKDDVDALTGKPIAPGDATAISQAQGNRKDTEQILDYYIKIIDKYGINSAKVYSGAGDNSFIKSEAVSLIADNEKAQTEIGELQTKDDAASKSRIVELERQIGENAEKITRSITPMNMLPVDHPAYDPNAVTSQKFSEEFRKMDMMNFKIDKDVRKIVNARYSQALFKPSESQIRDEMNIVKAKYVSDVNVNQLGLAANTLELFLAARDRHGNVADKYITDKLATLVQTQQTVTQILGGLSSDMNILTEGLKAGRGIEGIQGFVNANAGKFTEVIGRLRDVISDIGSVQSLTGAERDNIRNTVAVYNEALFALQEGLRGTEPSAAMTEMLNTLFSHNLAGTMETLDITPEVTLTRKTLTPEDRGKILDKFINEYVVGLTGVSKRDIPLTTSLFNFITSSQTLLKTEEPIEDQELWMLAIDGYKAYVESMKSYVEYNKDYFQDILERNPKDREHSLLKKSDVERITGDERNYIMTRLDEAGKELGRLEQEGLAKGYDTTGFSYVVRVHHLNDQIKLFEDVMNMEDEKEKQDREIVWAKDNKGNDIDLIWKAIDSINAIISKNPYLSSKDNPRNIEEFERLLIEYNTEVLNDDGTLNIEQTNIKKKVLLDETDKIENIINNLINELGKGRLDKVVNSFRGMMNKDGFVPHSALQPFMRNVVVSKKKEVGRGLSGTMSKFSEGKRMFHEYLNGRRGFDNTKESFAFYIWYKLTTLNWINRFGKNGTATYADVFDAYIEYMGRSVPTEKNRKAVNTEIPTYEQRMAVIQAVGFILNNEAGPAEDIFKMSSVDSVLRIQEGLAVLGYARTGKTTVLVQNVLGILSILNEEGKFKNRQNSKDGKIKVLSVPVNTGLKEIHEENSALVNEVVGKDKIDIDVRLYSEISNNWDILKDYDFIIFDEASTLDSEKIKDINAQMKKVETLRGLFLFDHGQLPPATFESHLPPPITYLGESTIPLVQIQSTDIVMYHMLLENLRTFDREPGSILIYPDPAWIDNKDRGLLGMRYIRVDDTLSSVQAVNKVVDDFIKEKKRYPEDDIVLIVFDEEARNVLLKRDDVIPFKDSIKILKAEGLNAVSGTGYNKVFVAIDMFSQFPEAFTTGGARVQYRDKFVQYAITAWSRPKLFLEMITDSSAPESAVPVESEGRIIGLNQMMRKIYGTGTLEEDKIAFTKSISAKVLRKTGDKTHTGELMRLENVRPENIVARDIKDKKIARKDAVAPDIRGVIYDSPLTKEEKEVLTIKVETENVASVFRDDVLKETAEGEGNLKHLSALDEVTATITRTGMSGIEKTRNALYSAVMRLFWNDTAIDRLTDYSEYTEKIDTVTNKDVIVLATEYKDAVNKYNETIEGRKKPIPPIEDVSGFVHSVIRAFKTYGRVNFHNMMSDPLFIKNPVLFIRSADNKSIIEGNPSVIEIVGLDKKGNYIVDIIHIQFVEKSKTKLRQYDIDLAGGYISMLQQKGYIVNNYRVLPITIVRKEHFAFEVHDEIIMGVSDKIKGVANVKSVFAQEYKPVMEEEYFSQKRIVPDPKRGIVSNQISSNATYKSKTTGEMINISEIFRIGNEVLVNVQSNLVHGETIDLVHGIEYIRDNFELYRPYTTELQEDLFASSSRKYSEDRVIYATSAFLTADQLNKYSKAKAKGDYWKRFDKEGNPINLVFALRDFILSEISKNKNLTLNPVYHPSLDGSTEEQGYFQSKAYKHVVTLGIDEKTSGEILKALEGEKGPEWLSVKNAVVSLVDKEGKQFANDNAKISYFIHNMMGNTIAVVGEAEINTKKDKVSDKDMIDLLAIDNQEDAIKYINTLMKESFAGDPLKKQLTAYNSAKLLTLWQVNKGFVTGVEVSDVISGSVVPTTGTGYTIGEFRDIARLYNFTIDPKIDVVKQEGKFPIVSLRLSRLGMSDVMARLSPVFITPEDMAFGGKAYAIFEWYESELRELYDTYDNEYKDLKGIEYGEFVAKINEFYKNHIEKTRFFSFLRSNSASTALLNSGDFDAWIRRDDIAGVHVEGEHPLNKLRSLDRLLKQIKTYITKQKGEGKELNKMFYYDMFESYETGKVDEQAVVLYAGTLGVPQVFITHDAMAEPSDFGEYDMVVAPGSWNLMTSDNAVSEINFLFGDSFKDSGLEINDGWIKNKTGVLVWGKMSDRLIRLSALNGMVHKFAPRHESMHYVMVNMLSPASFNSVMNDIKKILGSDWDGTTRQLHEYAANKFQGEELKVPKTAFEKFIQALQRFAKRLLMYLGLYRPGLNSLMNDMSIGVFRNSKTYSPNESIDLESARRDNIYSDVTAFRHVTGIFGSKASVDEIAQHNIAPLLVDYGPTGTRIDINNSSWVSAISDVLVNFKQYYSLGEEEVTVFGKDKDGEKEIVVVKRIKEMSSADFALTRAYREFTENNDVYKKYIHYHLSSSSMKSPYTIKILLQTLFPATDIDAIILQKVDPVKEGSFKYDVDAVHTDMTESMSDSMRMSMSAIPLKDNLGRRKKEWYVPFGYLHNMLIDIVRESVSGVTEVESRGYSHDFEGLMMIIDAELNSKESQFHSSRKQYVNYLSSFMFAFGDRRSGNIKIEEVDDYAVIDKTLEPVKGLKLSGYGLQGIINNRDKYIGLINRRFGEGTEESNFYIDRFEQKIRQYKEFLNGFAAYYFSPTTLTVTSAVLGRTGVRFESKNNTNIDLHKHNLKQSIQKNLFTNGILKDSKRVMLLDPEKRIWLVDDRGIYGADGTKIIDGVTFVYNKNNHSLYRELFHFMGIYLNPDEVDSIGRFYADLTKDNVLMKNLYYMMLATRLNGEMTVDVKVLDAEVDEDKSEYEATLSDESKKLYKKLMEFYDTMKYTQETADQMKNKGRSTLSQYQIPSPAQMWRFLEKIGMVKKYGDMSFVTRMLFDSDGNAYYQHTPGSSYSESIGQGSEVFMTQIQQEFNRIKDIRTRWNELTTKVRNNILLSDSEQSELDYIQRFALYNIDSVFIDIDDKGEPVFKNNPVFTKKINVANTSVLMEITHELFGVKFSKMTIHDVLKTLYEGTYNRMLDDGDTFTTIPVINDTQSDKASKYMSGLSYQKGGNLFSFASPDRKGNRIKSIFLHKDRVVDVFEDFVSYYDEIQRRSIKRWNNVLGTEYKNAEEIQQHLDTKLSEIERTFINDLLQTTKDVIIGADGRYFVGNHTSLEFVSKPDLDKLVINSDFISEWRGVTTIEEKFDIIEDYFMDSFSDFITLQEVNKYNPNEMITELAEGVITVVPNTIQTMPKIDIEVLGLSYPEAVFTTYEDLNAYKSFIFGDVSNALFNQRKMEHKKGIMKDLNSLFRLIYKSLNPSIYDNSLTKAIFYSHFIYNEAISQITRGGVLSHVDIIDYIKRAAGPQAPGILKTTHNVDGGRGHVGLARYSRAKVVNDIPGHNFLLSSKESDKLHTDGLIIMNPLILVLARRSAGGVSGNVTKGSQKWVNYKYNPFKDNTKYLKASLMPINERMFIDDVFFQDMIQMMMGSVVYDIFIRTYNDQSPEGANGDFDKALEKTADEVQERGLQSGMIDYIVHKSVLKNGIEKVSDYKKIDETLPFGPDNVVVDMSWNDGSPQSYESTIEIDNSAMRIQQLVSKDVVDSYKPIPIQVSYFMGIGAHNNILVNEYNNVLSDVVQEGIKLLRSLKTHDQISDYIRKSITRGLITSPQSGIFLDDIANNKVSIELYRSKAMTALLSGMNKYMKPTIPGTDAVQAPDFTDFYELESRPGILFRTKDMNVIWNADIKSNAVDLPGFRRRRLNTLRVIRVNTDGTSSEYYTKQSLLDDVNLSKTTTEFTIKIIPGETIMKFAYGKKFGIGDHLTLQDVMTLRIIDENGKTELHSMYQSSEDRALKVDQTYESNIAYLTGLYKNLSYEQIITTLPTDEVLRDKIRFWKPVNVKGAIKDFMSESDISHLIMNVASYYVSLNDALDIFDVRIPTTEGSSFGMLRLVAFDNHSSNTIFVSAEQSLLNGSDFDIDALQLFFNIQRMYPEGQLQADIDGITDAGIMTDKERNFEMKYKEAQGKMFSLYRRFSIEPLNLIYQLQVTTTATIEEFAKRSSRERSSVNTLGTTLKDERDNFSGKRITGISSSAANALVRVTHIPLLDRIAVKGKYIDTSIQTLFSDEKLNYAVSFLSELTNAGTEVAKLGGILGKLNINESTITLLIGMITSGYTQEKAYDILVNNEFLKDAVDLSNSSRNIQINSRRNNNKRFNDPIWNSISAVINTIPAENKEAIKELNAYKKMAFVGEQLRRLSFLTMMQRNVGASDFDAVNLRKNTTLALGMPISEFFANIDVIKVNGSKEFTKKYIPALFSDINEPMIRETIDLAWVIANNPLLISMVEMVDTLDDSINKLFTVYKFFNNGETILQKTGRTTWDFEDDLTRYLGAVEKHITGKYINTLAPVTMTIYDEDSRTDNVFTYDLKNTQEVIMFGLQFPGYLRTLQMKYTGVMNIPFIQKLSTRVDADGMEYVHLPDSNGLDPDIKLQYRREFDAIPNENDKHLIRLYQMLVYGTVYRNGSLNDVISNPLKEGLSSFMDGYKAENTNELAKEIIVSEALGNNNIKSDAEYITRPGKNGKVYTFRNNKDKTRTYLYNNLWKGINTYGNNDQISEYLPVPSMGLEDIINVNLTGEADVTGKKFNFRTSRNKKVIKMKTNGWNGIHMNPPRDSQHYNLISGSIAEMIDGTRVQVVSGGRNSNEFTVTKNGEQKEETGTEVREDGLITQSVIRPKGRYKTTDLYNSIIRNETSRMTNEMLDIYLEKIGIAFPNIGFVKTDNMDPRNLFPEEIAYIYKDKVWINTDRVLIDTLLHEVSHIFILHAKQNNIELYRSLMGASKEFVKMYPDIAGLFRKENMSDEMFYQELAARMMGWSTNNIIMEQLHAVRTTNVEERSKSIGAWIKELIQRFFTYVKDIVHGIFGIEIADEGFDYTGKTIFEIGQHLNDMINRGVVVSFIAPSELIRLQRIQQTSILTQSPIVNNITSEHLMRRKLTNSYDKVEYEDMNEDQRVEYLYQQIEGRNWRLSAMYSGTFIDFTDLKGDETAVKARIRELGLQQEIDEYPDKFRDNITKWLNVHKGSISHLDDLGKPRLTGEPAYSEKAMIDFKHIIDYLPTHEIMSLQEAKTKIPGFIYPSYFDSFKVTVNVKYRDKDQVVVSLYKIDNDSPHKVHEDVPKRNILYTYNVNGTDADLTKAESKSSRMGITLRNTFGAIDNFHLALLANELMLNNKKIKVESIGVIGLLPNMVISDFYNYYDILGNITKMGKDEGFMNDVPEALRKWFDGSEPFANIDIQYENIFVSMLDQLVDVDDFSYKARKYRDQFLMATFGEKKREMTWVLNKLIPRYKISGSSGDLYMIKTLTDALNNIGKFHIPTTHSNTVDNIGIRELYMSAAALVGEKNIQNALEQINEAEHIVSDKYLEYRDRKIPHFKYFTKAGYSVIRTDYKPFRATMKVKFQGKEVEVESGFVLWTNDEKKDPLYAKQARERGLSGEDLKHMEWVVDEITDISVENLYHYLDTQGSLFNPVTKKDYTKEEVRKLLFEQWGYKKGMVPVMGQTVMDMLKLGKMGQAMKKLKAQIASPFNIYNEAIEIVRSSAQRNTMGLFDSLPNLFADQFLDEHSTKYGSKAHLRAIGVSMNSDGTLEIKTPEDYAKNREITHDLETLLDYYKMSSLRKIQYEAYGALDVINGMMVVMDDIQNTGIKDVRRTKQFISMLSERVIYGIPKVIELKLAGYNIMPGTMFLTAAVSTYVLGFNVSVGILSTGINAIRAWTETIARSWEGPQANFGDIMKASAIFWTDIAKITELARRNHQINMDQYGLLTNRLHRVTRKSWIDPQIIHWTNWASDFYARAVMMVAQMIHDGTYDANVYDGKTRKVKYDMKLDTRYKDLKDPATKARYEAHKNMLINEGKMTKEDTQLTEAYFNKEKTSMKLVSDRIVGGYDNIAKANIANILIGRMFLMFRNYLVMAAEDAIHKGEWIDAAGRLAVKRSKTGEYVAEWEAAWIEGYLTMLLSDFETLIRTGSVSQFNPGSMSDFKKYNYRRLGARIAVFMLMYALYNGFADDDDLIGKGLLPGSDVDAPLRNTRVLRNWKYIMYSIFVLPQLTESLMRPSALIDITTRSFGFLTKKPENIRAKDIIPVPPAVRTVLEATGVTEND